MVASGADDLTTPLPGSRKGKRKPSRFVVPWSKIVFAVTGFILVSLSVYLAIAEDPLGGEPHATALIETRDALVRDEPPPRDDLARIAELPSDRMQSTMVEIESQSGVSVVRPDGSAGPQSVIITIPPDAPGAGGQIQVASPPARIGMAPAPDSRLVERTRHGMLPRIGDDGARAWEVYSRPPVDAAAARGRIAILVTGLGISQSATNDAIAKLPPDVTLAFAPYGSDLERLVSRARTAGHEVMLQVPMEPFDYPDNDPGPHTLTVQAKAEENREKLHWVMGRFAGYTGIVNFMGARLTADEAALTPIIQEIASRGLAILDDGTSSRSLVRRAAESANAPVARASLVIDAVPRAEAIDAMLVRLEEQALNEGFAIATASALPLSVDRIARWAVEASERGIVLVPVSAAFRNEVRG
ncbi:MAG TPA: divergent polysaccharide deacetylase family protein [Saliniramus sp.]|nr:divergent polysaccharide deacetylase family protein [Saliniramus sp.]